MDRLYTGDFSQDFDDILRLAGFHFDQYIGLRRHLIASSLSGVVRNIAERARVKQRSADSLKWHNRSLLLIDSMDVLVALL